MIYSSTECWTFRYVAPYVSLPNIFWHLHHRACDKIYHNKLWNIPHHCGYPTHLMETTKCLYNNSTIQMDRSEKSSEGFSIKRNRETVIYSRLYLVLTTCFAHWKLYVNKIQWDVTVCRCLFTAKLPYLFRVSIAPIIRSTSNCNCSFWYRS